MLGNLRYLEDPDCNLTNVWYNFTEETRNKISLRKELWKTAF